MFYIITLCLLLVPNIVNAESYAILVSGGDSAGSNHCDFFDDIDRANNVLSGWKKVNLVSDGDIPNGPANSLKCDSSRNTLRGSELVRTQTQSPIAGKATKIEIKAQLEKISTLKPGEPVLLYFTNHGGRDISNGDAKFSLSLWQENLTKEDLQTIIKDFKLKYPNNPLMFIHDHCFSGGMMDNFINPTTNAVIPGVCGFSAASATEYSYNGQSYMRKAETMFANGANQKSTTFANIFDQLKFKDSIYSTPTSTSDAFLEKLYEKNQAKLGKVTPETLGCSQEVFTSSLVQLQKAVQGISKFMYDGNLKQRITELRMKAEVSPDTSIEQLEILLKNKINDVLESEKRLENAEDAVDMARNKWALDKFSNIYGDAVSDLILADGVRPDAIIPLRDGGSKSQLQLYNELRAIKRTATKDNNDFQDFVTAGSHEGQWPSDLLDRPAQFKSEFADKNTEAGPLIRLVQTSRRAVAFEHLSPNEREQYMNLLNCENTPIKVAGKNK